MNVLKEELEVLRTAQQILISHDFLPSEKITNFLNACDLKQILDYELLD